MYPPRPSNRTQSTQEHIDRARSTGSCTPTVPRSSQSQTTRPRPYARSPWRRNGLASKSSLLTSSAIPRMSHRVHEQTQFVSPILNDSCGRALLLESQLFHSIQRLSALIEGTTYDKGRRSAGRLRVCTSSLITCLSGNHEWQSRLVLCGWRRIRSPSTGPLVQAVPAQDRVGA